VNQTTPKPGAVRPSEILVGPAYEAERPALRARVMQEKARRRVHLGDHLTFLFENPLTVRYQVQEMLRVEKRSAPEDIQHEVRTYNELLGGPGELGATLLIEIDDPQERDLKLGTWLDLPAALYLELEDGRRVTPRYDERQVGDERLSSVQYLIFPCGDSDPIAIGSSLDGLALRVELTPVQRRALADDLRDTRS
jgi:hypothetical protein